MLPPTAAVSWEQLEAGSPGPVRGKQPETAGLLVRCEVPSAPTRLTAGSWEPISRNPVPVRVKVRAPPATHARSGVPRVMEGGPVMVRSTLEVLAHPAGDGLLTVS